MRKKYKDMTIHELFAEKKRIEHRLNSKTKNYISFKQNKASLKRVSNLICRKVIG